MTASRVQTRDDSRPIVIDLFSGTGGLSLGAARAGFDVRCAVEIDPQALAAHQVNFPGTVHLATDISKLTALRLQQAADLKRGTLAGLIGGPPCQGFSCIGKFAQRDPRNRLFAHFFRLVNEMKPTFFLAENVPGILQARNDHTRASALALVEDDYVLLPPITVTASDWGAPTSRTRVLFIGFRSDEMSELSVADFVPSRHIAPVRVRDALKGLPRKVSANWRTEEDGWRRVRAEGRGFYIDRLHGCVPSGVGNPAALARLRTESKASGFLGTVHSAKLQMRYAEVKPGTRDEITKSAKLDPDGFCPTLRAGTGFDKGRFQAVRPLHPTENRVITPREAARLQGFPDWFQFAPTRWHSFRLLGNSVSPILAERVMHILRKALSG